MFQPTWHCCMCCYPANGRVDFEDGWLAYKNHNFIVKKNIKLGLDLEPKSNKEKNLTKTNLT